MRLENRTEYAGIVSGELVAGVDLRRVEAERTRQLEEARRIAVERPLSDFDVIERTPERVFFIDKSTGTMYRRLTNDVLGDDGGKATNDVDCFVIDQGGKLHFLRERGKPDTPSLVVRHGPVVGRNVAFDLAVTDEHGVEISVYAGMYATREYVGDIANWFNPLLDVPQT